MAVEWEQGTAMGLGVWPAGELEGLKRMKRGCPNIIIMRLHHSGPNVKCGQRTHELMSNELSELLSIAENL